MEKLVQVLFKQPGDGQPVTVTVIDPDGKVLSVNTVNSKWQLMSQAMQQSGVVTGAFVWPKNAEGD